MLTTTLNEIRQYSPCADGWEKLLRAVRHDGDDPLPLETILDSNGIGDALWVFDLTQDKRLKMMLAVTYARRTQHLMTDWRSINALNVAERWAHGQVTYAGLEIARAGARAGALAASWAAAREIARAAARPGAYVAERDWQVTELRRVCREGLAAYGLTEGEE